MSNEELEFRIRDSSYAIAGRIGDKAELIITEYLKTIPYIGYVPEKNLDYRYDYDYGNGKTIEIKNEEEYLHTGNICFEIKKQMLDRATKEWEYSGLKTTEANWCFHFFSETEIWAYKPQLMLKWLHERKDKYLDDNFFLELREFTFKKNNDGNKKVKGFILPKRFLSIKINSAHKIELEQTPIYVL